MRSLKSCDQPLECEVVGDRLVVSIGIDTLAFADVERLEIPVTNTLGFARDVVTELVKENEIGETLLNKTLDAAMQAARDNGSVHVRH